MREALATIRCLKWAREPPPGAASLRSRTSSVAVLSPHGDSTAAVQSGWFSCVEPRISLSPCCSRRELASAWHLMTTDNFTVPLQVLYQLSLLRVRLPQAACTLHIYAVSGLSLHDSPAPSALFLPHDMNLHVCDLPPTCRAQDCLLTAQQG